MKRTEKQLAAQAIAALDAKWWKDATPSELESVIPLAFDSGISPEKVEGPIEPKSHAGRRQVPIAGVLRDYLVEHKLRCAWSEGGLVFGRSAAEPFSGWAIASNAERVWKAKKLARITLHECRHTFASLMIAAGVNAKALSTYLGHASVTITYDRYGHLMPGNEGRGSRPARQLPQAGADREGRSDCGASCGADELDAVFCLQIAGMVRGLQNRCGRVTHGSVGSTPAPLREPKLDPTRSGAGFGQASRTRARCRGRWTVCA